MEITRANLIFEKRNLKNATYVNIFVTLIPVYHTLYS